MTKSDLREETSNEGVSRPIRVPNQVFVQAGYGVALALGAAHVHYYLFRASSAYQSPLFPINAWYLCLDA